MFVLFWTRRAVRRLATGEIANKLKGDGERVGESDSAPAFAAGALQRANRGANTLPPLVRHHDILFIKLEIYRSVS